MRVLKIVAIIALFSSCAFAQKPAPLPKDLPPYGPEKPVEAPSVKIAKLDNGLTVWLVSEPGFPKLSYTVAIRGGYAADPNDRPGISELLSNTIDQGTKLRNARKIAEEFQGAGGDLSASAGRDEIDVSTTILASKAEAAIAVLADILQNASFPDDEVALAKKNLADSLQQQEADPSFLASRAVAKVLFGTSPYHVMSPTQESIAASTPADLRRIYAQRFRPDQTVFIAVGDFRNEKMLELVKTNLGGWRAPVESPIAEIERLNPDPAHAIFLVERPGSVQTTIELAAAGPLRSDPDYESAVVANAIYGGTFGSRLTLNIREDKGYTYSPFAALNTYRAAGDFVTRADVRNAVTGATYNEMSYELNRMVTTSPTAEELTQAKRFLVGIEAIRLQIRSSVAAALADLWVKNLPPEEIGIYGKKIAATTSDDVDAAAKKYLPASHAAVVAVGEGKVVREALAPFGIPIQPAP
ncbi:MAG: pitrilysin family protein [Candidatus Acidiferrales bacterium]